MNDTLHDVARWADRGDRIAIAMVVGAVRSAPRRLGTKMAINDLVRSPAVSRGAPPLGAALDKRRLDVERRVRPPFGSRGPEADG